MNRRPAMDHGWSWINHPSVAFTGKALHATTDAPVRQPGYIQDPSEGLGASGLSSLESLETQPLRSHALDLFIERGDFLVAPRGFRLARIRFAQLVESFLDGQFFGVGHDAIPDANGCSDKAHYFLKPEKSFSNTSPIGCHVRPSNWISRNCLIGRKSQGPVVILRSGSSIEAG
jgi:hypothetical protein